MPSPPRSVFDGLEGVWDDAVAGWRAVNARREEAEALKARMDREAAQAIGRGLERAAGTAKSRVDRVVRRLGDSRPAAVADALFGERVNPEPEAGPIDYHEVDDRIDATRRASRVARASSDPRAEVAASIAAGAQWFNRVKPGGRWDDKKSLPDGERQGNFSYGATAAALGLPLEVALRGAGFYQRKQAVEDALGGKRGQQLRARQGFLGPPYGDEARDQRAITEGYAYGRRRGR